ncbi:LysW-gamma-L-lysine carboxypeptidase [Streptosporangium becharense]|uniref:LysW-gamma-L-lysine carboxypeptidase n=1 Tax=Streptosporangium becharense TaxID=1816182 RepID=A0A7W9ILY7_9ACTN|nr:M20/M25/M40 family metallo-hydrolase [Streptosporangium becharense]MBB2910419.1 LysW-gamma-L-lysine carboxypeptidase [Streptosporangium becharense]MBB5823162.1 LysW-gamma-L-lysine carboxypeptidase [Streptosporangium becharense]
MKPSGEYAAWLLRGLLSIPSVSGEEGRAAAFAADQMSRLGMRARVDEIGNAVGEAGPPGAPTVLLLGHIDTVPGRLAVCQVGDLLYGRGAVDAKGPLAAMICAGAAAASAGVRVVVVGAVGEEVPGSRGTRHLLRTLPRPDAVVIGEPSGWDGVCLGYKGRVGVVYDVRRTAMHTSSPEETAVEAAALFWTRVEDYVRRLPGAGDAVRFDACSATLVDLRGDIRQAHARITCRVPEGFDFDAFHRFVKWAAVQAEARFDERVPAVRRGLGDPAARALRAAIREHGGTPATKLKAGTSDMNVVAEHWDVPMVAYGPGDAHLDHTDDEHIAIPDLYRSVAVLGSALRTLGRLTAGPVRRDELTPTAGRRSLP